MSKGGGLGRGAGAGAKAARAIARMGGVLSGSHLRSGMRAESQAYHAGLFASARSATAAQRIADRLDPIRVRLDRGGTMHIADGRHRASAAKAAGATHIRAHIQAMGRDGSVQTVRARVKL